MVLTDVAMAIAGLALERLVDHIDVSRRKARLQQNIAEAYRASFEYVLNTYQLQNLHNHLDDFLGHPDVQLKLSRLAHPHQQPSVECLCNRWQELYESSEGDLGLIFKELIRVAEKRLAEIPELAPVLNLRISTQIRDEMREGFRTIGDQSAALTPSSDASARGDPSELHYDVQLDTCRDLYLKYRPRAALDQLRQLEESLRGERVSNHLRSRLHTLIGLCELALGETAEGVKHLNNAYTLQPKAPNVQANYALALFLEGKLADSVKMADQALAQDPKGTNARAVRTWALAQSGTCTDLDELVDDVFMDDASYVRALGLVFLQAGLHARAEEYLRVCVAQNDRDVQGRVLLIQALLAKAVPEIEIGLSVTPNRCPNPALDELLELADQTVALAKQGDSPSLLHEALIERARVRATCDDAAGAKIDLNQILQEDGANEPAIYNLGLIFLNDGDADGALRHFERIPGHHRALPVWQAMAYCYLALDRLPDARRALTKAESHSAGIHLRFLRAQILIKEGKRAEAESIREKLREHGSPVSLGLAALVSRLLGDRVDEVQLLTCAQESSSGAEKERLATDLALVHFENERPEEAAIWFGRAGDRVYRDTTFLRLYVGSLLATKKYQQVYELAERAWEQGIHDPALLDIQAKIAEARQDYPAALQLHSQLHDLEPHEPLHHINVARCACLMGETDRAREALLGVDVPRLSDPITLAPAAELLSFLGEHLQAVMVAYRALRLGHHDPDIHLLFVRLFLAHDHELPDLRPDQVRIDTAVRIQNESERFWVRILEPELCRDRWDVAPDSPLARRLIGHRVGDHVSLREGGIEHLTYEIVEIQSILLRQFQESLALFSTFFPDNPNLQKGEVKDGDISPVLMAVAQMGIRNRELLHFYDTGMVPLESFAHLMGHHRYDVQRGLWSMSDHRLRCSLGSSEAQDEERLCARGATSITIDLSALITLQSLGRLSELSERFDRIYVPQHLSSDLVVERSRRNSWGTKAKHTIAYSDGRWQLTEISDEAVLAELARLDELLAFVQTGCEPVPVAIEHTRLLTDPEERASVVGQVTLATLLVAQQTSTPLYADDLALRRLAEHEFGCASFWTFPLLADLVDRSLMSLTELQDATIQLILRNYHYVPPDSETIMRAIRSLGSTDLDTRKVMAVLAGPHTSEAAAITIAAQTLKAVWLDNTLAARRTFISDAILSSIVAGRMREKVIALLIEHLRALLNLAPVHLQQALGHIAQWSQIVAPTLVSRGVGGRAPAD